MLLWRRMSEAWHWASFQMRQLPSRFFWLYTAVPSLLARWGIRREGIRGASLCAH